MDWMKTLGQMNQSAQGGYGSQPAYQASMGAGNRPYAPGVITGWGQTPETLPHGASEAAGASYGAPPVSAPQNGGSASYEPLQSATGASQQYTPQMHAQVVERIMTALDRRARASRMKRVQLYRGGSRY